MKTLNRNEVLGGKWRKWQGWRTLEWSEHAIKRMEDRSNGSFIIFPKTVNVSEDNVAFGLAHENTLHRVGVSILYKTGVYLIMVLSGSKVITAYFKDISTKNKKHDKKSQQDTTRKE
jgi:hypothetical protein